ERVVRWAEGGQVPESITVTKADYKTLPDAIRKGEDASDVVLIDVEGSANLSVSIAVGHAHYVAIPANPSAADVEDAIDMVRLVHDIAERSKRPPLYAVLWTRVPTGFRTREYHALAKQLDEAGVPVCDVVLSERSAYKSLISYSTTLDRLPPDEVPSLDKARIEGRALADSITAAIVNAQENAA
ncbi:MAG: hypothetical protein EOO77_40290, partial [Oxalobacteraceae bacterium]